MNVYKGHLKLSILERKLERHGCEGLDMYLTHKHDSGLDLLI